MPYVLGYLEREGIAFMTLDIALPFYGDVEFMKKTVHSILNQNNPNWRLIVVDDGYPDESIPGWFQSLSDSRIEYQRNPNNLGANGNFQKCLGLLSAEYCLVMGADDLLEPNFVDRIVHCIEENQGISMIHPGVKVIDEHDNEIYTRSDQVKKQVRDSFGNSRILKGESLAKSLMNGNWMYFPSIVWKTKTIQEIGFREGFHVCQDLGLAMDLIMQGGELAVIDDVVFRYRRHNASDSSVKALNGERFIDEKKFFKAMSYDLKQLGWNSAAMAARIHLTSRLHAASLVPKALAAKKNPWNLIKHSLM
jgi:glycosyltransferase involved in cell wall biosynthesis